MSPSRPQLEEGRDARLAVAHVESLESGRAAKIARQPVTTTGWSSTIRRRNGPLLAGLAPGRALDSAAMTRLSLRRRLSLILAAVLALLLAFDAR